MCAIAGIWNRDGQPVVESTLQQMISTMVHRGRDGSGTYIDGDLGLAHLRMSIIDLSDAGQQPMVSADKRYHINFNGEIHNYIELRKDLETAGYQFHTATDTEVALASYVIWGDSCFNKFNGMWAIAIWDAHDRELVLCRDRFGIKPLFYSIRGNRLAFASEIKAIVQGFAEERQPNYSQMYGYLNTGETDSGDITFFENIKSMLPGELIKVNREKFEHNQYWDFSPGTERNHDDVEEEFRWLMFDATRIRLRSDTPMAVWLSGGLDSSVITRIMSELVDQPLECYSLRYDNWEYDESAYAAAVADQPEKYHMQWVTPNDVGMFEKIRQIVHYHDAPTPMRGRYAMWHLAEETAKSQKVVLTGDGSDELFGGYETFIAPYFIDLIRNFRSMKPGVMGEFLQLAESQSSSKFQAIKSIITPLLFRWGIDRPRSNRIMADSFKKQYGYTDLSEHMAGWACRNVERPYNSAFNNATWYEFSKRGLPEILRGFDAISMAHTLESRSPFLDHRVVEFCLSLAFTEKIGGGYTKHLLRRAFKDRLPTKVRDRRIKLGFQSPVVQWMQRDSDLSQISQQLMDGTCVADGIFDPRRIQKRIQRIKSGQDKRSGATLWNWINMEYWYSKNIHNSH